MICKLTNKKIILIIINYRNERKLERIYYKFNLISLIFIL